jgi:hypothetical protein
MTEERPLPAVALLAPVPWEHLVDGQHVARAAGRVAFGSRAWEVFSKLDTLRRGQPVDAWIYASHAAVAGVPTVRWRARYLGQVGAVAGAHPQGSTFRPPSTLEGGEDRGGHWALFWEVEGLHELAPADAIRVSAFQGLDRKTRYSARFVPEGPLLVRPL